MNAPSIRLGDGRVPYRRPKGGLVPSLERIRLRLHLLQLVIDSALLLGCSAAFAALWSPAPWEDRQILLGAQLLLPLFLTLALHNGTYSQESLVNWRRASLRMASALVIGAMLLQMLAFFAKFNAELSRAVFMAGMVFGGVAMAASRLLLHRWMVRTLGPSPINRLVIDAGGEPLHIPHAYRVSARDHALSPTLDDPHALDRLAQCLRNMDEVIVACPLEDRLAWARVLKSAGVHGEVTSNLAHEIGALGVVRHPEGSTLLVSTGPLGIRARVAKRLFDIGLSSLALLLLSPLLLLVALLVKLEDGGPVFFRQRRLGRGNRFFPILKFRSMRVESCDAAGDRSTGRDDDRITRIGRFIRSTSIDELPQLINVLRGDMSIVGPRPHALGSQAGDKLFWQVDSRYWQRHALRPGITGLAQVRGLRGATEHESDLSSRLQSDLEYVAGWSILRDIRIILATFRVLVHDRAF